MIIKKVMMMSVETDGGLAPDKGKSTKCNISTSQPGEQFDSLRPSPVLPLSRRADRQFCLLRSGKCSLNNKEVTHGQPGLALSVTHYCHIFCHLLSESSHHLSIPMRTPATMQSTPKNSSSGESPTAHPPNTSISITTTMTNTQDPAINQSTTLIKKPFLALNGIPPEVLSIILRYLEPDSPVCSCQLSPNIEVLPHHHPLGSQRTAKKHHPKSLH